MTTCRRRPEALENKASPSDWCPQICGASASHGRASTRTQNNSVPSTRSNWRRVALRQEQREPTHNVWRRRKGSEDRAQVTTHSACGDEGSSEATASSHARRLGRRRKATSLQSDAKRSGTPGLPEQKQHLWSRDECLHGRTQLWASATRELMPQEDITHTTPSMVTPTEAREAGERGKGEPCSPPETKPQGRLARRGQVDHTEHKDDPEEERP